MFIPTLSIITPSYNQARFLDETIRSVLAQRDQVHEYFVYDGGSTDGSVDIIRRYADRLDHWQSARDKGQSDAIHQGFVRATGDILYWLNSDDVLLPGALARVRAAFARHPQWDVLTGYGCYVDADSRMLGFFRMPAESRWMASHGVLHVCQQTCFFKRTLYQRVGGLNLNLHCVMDTDLWTRMMEAGSHWGAVGAYLACFRQHQAAKGSSWLKEYEVEHQIMRERYPAYFNRMNGRPVLILDRARQILTGRRWAAIRDTQRWKGRPLMDFVADAFPGVAVSVAGSPNRA